MNQTELQNAQHVFDKTQQVVRIFSQLWEERLAILSLLYRQQQKTFFRRRRLTQEQIQDLLSRLHTLNARERKIIEILKKSIPEAMQIVESASALPGGMRALLSSQASNYEKNIVQLLPFLRRYQRLIMLQEDILDAETSLIKEGLEAQVMDIYLKRIVLFEAEVNALMQQIESLNERVVFFRKIQQDLEVIRANSGKKSIRELLLPSSVSAVVRVFVSNIIAAATIGNPLENPYFWDLTWRTMVSVWYVNMIDYKTNVFTALSNKITRFIRLAKKK
ncbi:hypothetical protein J4464_05915 [Candidatus Woesearchaeota archaeon]|nr:hypothetical protein [Candidatus Woesearchaeota archaeon]